MELNTLAGFQDLRSKRWKKNVFEDYLEDTAAALNSDLNLNEKHGNNQTANRAGASKVCRLSAGGGLD